MTRLIIRVHYQSVCEVLHTNRTEMLIRADVRFGSLADICSAKGRVRFAPNSDRKSGFPQTVMSAFPPKADMCGALGHVCFGPIADIADLIRSPRRRVQA